MSDAQPQSATNPITELKVTAHLMAMEPGLYCVYSTPGAAVADGRTGLPGVRITAAPGQGGLPGQVAVSGFNTEGWLGGSDGAVLVRIGGGPAQVLVTVYQNADGAQDAPKLQVIRLSDQSGPAPAIEAPEAAPAMPEAPEPAAAPAVSSLEAAAPAASPLEVAAHIYGRGDVTGSLGEWMGEPGSKRWIEGFGLAPAGLSPADIEYQAVLGRGWLSPWAEGGQFCGSRGMSLPILGLRVRLRGAAAETADLHVSATFVDGSRVGPVPDGGALEAPSLSPLEAFQVTLHRRAPAQPAPAQPAAMRPATAIQASPAQPAAPAKPRRAKAPPAPPEPPAPARQASRKATSVKAAPVLAPEPPAAAPAPAEMSPRPAAKRAPATTRRR